MRILITGSRDWTDAATIHEAMTGLLHEHGPEELTLVHGDCPTGADRIANDEAVRTGWECVERHPADWSLGRLAGPRRNIEMVALGADLCLAFVGPCERARCHQPQPHGSHGASGCARLAERAGIPTRRFPDHPAERRNLDKP